MRAPERRVILIDDLGGRTEVEPGDRRRDRRRQGWVETHSAQWWRRHREHDVRTEVLATAGGYTNGGAVTTDGRDGRVEDQRRTERVRHRSGERRVPTRAAHRLRLAVEHSGGRGRLCGDA